MKTFGDYTPPQFLLNFERITKLILKKSGEGGGGGPAVLLLLLFLNISVD